MTLKQLWSLIRGRRTNYKLFGISWTYYPEGDPLGKILMAKTGGEIDCPCNADCSAMPNGPLYNCPYLPENRS